MERKFKTKVLHWSLISLIVFIVILTIMFTTRETAFTDTVQTKDFKADVAIESENEFIVERVSYAFFGTVVLVTVLFVSSEILKLIIKQNSKNINRRKK